ncbi:unnamed protein product [Nezara viridula]|uniref:Uncharacterized protein n=1 Tax=Nezara viridula TaxID=85310 RepID=A0A9P0MLH8_NEZVI|nr:unnamed protein product [Nezara viridula]
MRICPSGQTQPQPDPKQQPQTQSMQGGMPAGINYSQQQSRPPQFYSRPSQPRVPARPMMTQAVPSSSMPYQPPATILQHPYLPQPMPTAGVLLPYAGPTIQSGRQHSHGGGQAVGATATPQPNYYTTQQQIFMTTQHATIGNPFTHQYSPHAGAPHYVYSQLRNSPYSTPNSGPHQGVPPQPPPQQPPQQYTVDAVPNAGGGGPTAAAGSGVLITHGHPQGPPQPTIQPQKRRRTPLSIIDPSSGRNVIEDYLSEKSQIVETTITPTAPVPTGVAADFAARVAAVATEPTCPEEEEEEEEEEETAEETEIETINGPESTPAPLVLAPPSSAVEVIPPPTVVPPMIQSQTQPSIPQPQPSPVIQHHQPAPQQAVPQPLSQSQQIPTVSAMTDSPTVELPRPKVPSVAILPGRKSSPVPQNVLEPSKKKEKKIVGVTGGLPPHKEEPEETKKSSFAEALNLKNISQSNIIKTAEPLQSLSNPSINTEPETNGEPEIIPVPAPIVPAPQPVKHHEKQKQHDEHATHQQHDRGGKASSRPKQKKKANLMKELNRRGQEKEGGSDMDAFTSLPPISAATNASLDSKASSSPPPAPASAPAPAPVVQQAEVVPPQPADQAPVVSQQQPSVNTQQQPPLPSTPVSDSPAIPQTTIIPPAVTNKNIDNEQDEGMGEEEVAEEVEIMVAVKNEENTKASAAAKEKVVAVNDVDESIVIETTVIERSKPPVLKYTYKEDQWSPLNPDGKKVYDRDFLLGLRTEALSIKRPDIEDCDIIKTDGSSNNNVSSNNNNRRLHGSNSMGMNRDERFITPPFLSRASSSQRGGMMGKRGSQQGRPGGDRRSGKIMYSSSQYKPDVDEDLHWAGKQGWKPERCKSPPKLSEEEIKTENLYKKIRGILNKLTPQKFDTLLEQITRLPIDTQDRLKGVVELVFDKAVDEPSFSIAYAKLCQNLSKMSVKIVREESQGGENSQPHAEASFRKVLLTRCQQMFEKKRKEETGEDGKKSDDERIAELQQSVGTEENREKKKELQLLLEEEERKIRVKYVGLARFIGELFKLQMLTASIMHGCIKTLLEKIEEESLECLCKLLTTVGKELESQCSDTKDMDEYFGKMRKLSQKSSNSKVSSRVRFMLQDVIELRSNRWVPRRDENNPKTMEQIQRDAEKELENAAMSSIANRSKHNDRDMDRRRGQRSGTNQDPEGWSTPKPGFRSYAFDQSKLQHIKGLDNETSSVLGCPAQFSQWNLGSNAKRGDAPKPFAPTTNKFALLSQDQEKKMPSMARKVTPSSSQEKERAVQGVRDAFIRDERGNRGQGSNPPSRENSRVRGKTPSMTHVPVVEQEPPPPVVKEPPMDPEVCKKKARVIFEEWLANHNVQESVDCIQESFPEAMLFVRSLLDTVLEGKQVARTSFGELLADLLSRNIVTASDFTKELQVIIECGEDFMIDLPLFWTYLAELLVPLLVKSVYTLADFKAACETCKTTHLTLTLAEIFRQLTKEKGPFFIKQQWESSDVQFTDFFPESDVNNFIKNNKCGFLIGEGEVVETGESLPMDQVEEKLLNLLKSDNNDKIFDQICDWIKANVGNRTQGTDFIRALTRAVIKANIKNDYHLNSSNLMKHEKLIKRYVDANETRELACLHGIQNLVVVQMMSPQGLLMEIFQSLWENGIISHEAFMKWKSCEDTQYEAEGKGVAVASLSPFFVSLSEQDDTDDESS